MKTTFKGHPLMMFRLLKPFLFVLLLPLLKGIAEYLIYKTASGILFSELILGAVVIVISLLRLRAFSLNAETKKITVRQGVILKRCSSINFSQISSLSVYQNPLDALFGAVTFKINTEAGKVGKTDFEFKLNKNDGKTLENLLCREENHVMLSFKNSRIVAAAALGSSAVAGIVVGVPVINQMGKLLGIALSKIVFNGINSAANKINTYFPPVFNVLTLVLLISYLFSFLYTVLKTLNFKLKAGKLIFEVQHGVLIRKRIFFERKSINDICVEQTPLLRLFKRYTVYAAVGGYGGSKKEKALLVPIADRNEIENDFSAILDFLKPNGITLMAARNRKTYMRFVKVPFISAVVTVLLLGFIAGVFEHFSRFAVLVMFVMLGFFAYYTSICIYNYRYGKLILGENIYARSSYRFNTREMHLPKEKTGCIRILQNPFDKRKNTCRVKITVCSESADSLQIRHLDINAAKENIAEVFEIEYN